MITFYVRCSRKIRKSSEASEIDPVWSSKIIGVVAIILDDQTGCFLETAIISNDQTGCKR